MSRFISKSDKNFIRQFALMITVLAVFAVGMLVIAAVIYHRQPDQQDPNARANIKQRLAPVGAVYAGDTGRKAMKAAKSKAAEGGEAAYGGTTDGHTIFKKLCSTCHADGINGAPKVGNADDWDSRIAEGKDTLVKHAINGYSGDTGVMPPKGGNSNLTKEQITNTVEWMTSQVK